MINPCKCFSPFELGHGFSKRSSGRRSKLKAQFDWAQSNIPSTCCTPRPPNSVFKTKVNIEQLLVNDVFKNRYYFQSSIQVHVVIVILMRIRDGESYQVVIPRPSRLFFARVLLWGHLFNRKITFLCRILKTKASQCFTIYSTNLS